MSTSLVRLHGGPPHLDGTQVEMFDGLLSLLIEDGGDGTFLAFASYQRAARSDLDLHFVELLPVGPMILPRDPNAS